MDGPAFVDFEEAHGLMTLHDTARNGDEDAVRRLVASGADVNAVDAAGRSIVVSIILADSDNATEADVSNASMLARRRLDVLRYLIEVRDTSLYTLNAPQACMHGVTPLGMAAYLNQLEIVSALLEQSCGLVAVDGMDSHGATPLMYAARDGNVNVVRRLLEHGARSDLKDANHRSATQYATRHPQTLWLCESSLRRQRAMSLESSKCRQNLKLSVHPPVSTFGQLGPTPPLAALLPPHTTKSVQSLIGAIASSNLNVLRSLLFPPLLSSSSASRIIDSTISVPPVMLVNQPDAKGWSPIHYCTTALKPDIKILDMLYLAGADVGLYTSGDHNTPLHCLAHAARESSDNSSFMLYSFIVHLVRDLRAPLAAGDLEGETCLHIAAEHGRNIIVLMAFLECDNTGTVVAMRNSRGLTPLEVARPEFRIAFGTDDALRPASSNSVRTIKPSISTTSLSSAFSFSTTASSGATRRYVRGRSPCLYPLSLAVDVPASSELIIDNLRALSRDLREPPNMDLVQLECLLQDTATMGSVLLGHFRDRIDDALDELRDCQRIYGKIDALIGMMDEVVTKRQRAALACSSPASQSSSSLASATLVNSSTGSHRSSQSSSDSNLPRGPPLPVLQKQCLLTPSPKAATPQKKHHWPSWLKPFIPKHGADFSKSQLEQIHEERTNTSSPFVSLKKTYKIKSFTKSRRKEIAAVDREEDATNLFVQDQEHDLVNISYSSPSSVASSIYNAGVSSQLARQRFRKNAENVDTDLHSAVSLLDAARRDATKVDELMTGIEQTIALAFKSLSQAETLMSKILMAQEHGIQSLKLSRALADLADLAEGRDSLYSCRSITPELFTFPSSSSPIARMSISSADSSANTSTASFSSLLAKVEGGEEDTRILCRLLSRKLPARVDGVFDDVEKVTAWLAIIRETTRTVQKKVKL